MAVQNHLLSNSILIRPDDNDDSDSSLQGETMKVQVNIPFKYPYLCLSLKFPRFWLLGNLWGSVTQVWAFSECVLWRNCRAASSPWPPKSWSDVMKSWRPCSKWPQLWLTANYMTERRGEPVNVIFYAHFQLFYDVAMAKYWNPSVVFCVLYYKCIFSIIRL